MPVSIFDVFRFLLKETKKFFSQPVATLVQSYLKLLMPLRAYPDMSKPMTYNPKLFHFLDPIRWLYQVLGVPHSSCPANKK